MANIVISQPVLFPWPGFFSHLLSADFVVWLDDAQFSKGWYTNRFQLMNELEQGRWLTIPVTSSSHFNKIADLKAAKEFQFNHLNILNAYYRKAPYKEQILELYSSIMLDDTTLSQKIIRSVECTFELIHGYKFESCMSSELGVEGSSSDRVLSICKKLGACKYITGHGARRYLDHPVFDQNGIKVEYMNYNILNWGRSTTRLSILDLIATVGLKHASEYYLPSTLYWKDFLRLDCNYFA